ncbi:MAG: type II secretion system protein GspM [Alphaproteobacteria bacterium]
MSVSEDHHQARTERRRNRLVAWSLLALTTLVIWGFVVQPVLSAIVAGERTIAGLESQLDRARRQAAQMPGLDARLAEVFASPQRRALYLFAADETEAQALLRQMVGSVLDDAGLEVVSVDALATARGLGGLDETTVRVRLRGGLAGIQQALYRLEEARPLLILTNMNIRSRTRRAGDAPPLEVEMDVSGFRPP